MRSVLPLLLAGCVIGGDKYPRPRDLSPVWAVDATRILAIQAEPPEVRPGGASRLSALVASPPGEGEDLAIVWLACPADGSGTGFGCASSLGSTAATPADPGAFGVGETYDYTAPVDLLDDLTADERVEGAYVLVQTTAMPPEVFAALVADPTAELDYGAVDAGYKRLVVSEAITPNHNPTLSAFAVDGLAVPVGATVHVDPDQPYELSILLEDGAREAYEYVDSDGVVEDRVEEPYAAWFAGGTDDDGLDDAGGELLESVTLWPYMEASWVSPAAPGESGTWYVVVRDRRGGMAWWTQPWVTE